jgi:hypothetical protein
MGRKSARIASAQSFTHRDSLQHRPSLLYPPHGRYLRVPRFAFGRHHLSYISTQLAALHPSRRATAGVPEGCQRLLHPVGEILI